MRIALAGFVCLALLAGSVHATTVGFVGAAGVNLSLPADYASNVSASGTGWTTTDGTGATPHIALDWGNSTQWVWEFHNANTFDGVENLHTGGAWDAVSPNTAVAQLQSDQPNGRLELNFSVIPGVKLVLNSLDIGNATDQTGSDGSYGFDLALVKNSNSAVVWTHSTPEFEAGQQQSVPINYTGDLGEDYTLTFTRHGQGSGVTFRSGLDNLSFSEILTPSAPQFELIVNRSTGGISLRNAGSTAQTVKGYSITSEAGALNASGWKAIAGNYDINGNGSVDPNDNWTKLTQPGDSNELAEFEFGGDGAVIGAGSSVVLNQAAGNAWVKSPYEELALDLVLADGEIYRYGVQYINGPVGGYAVGDLNFDGAVNALDWPAYHSGRGVDMTGMSAVAAYRIGDLDGDFDNDIADFVLFKQLATGSLSAFSLIPEPLAAGLLLTACGVVSIRRPTRRVLNFRRRSAVTNSMKMLLIAMVLVALVAGATQATTLGFRGAQSANNLDIPASYGSNIASDGVGWVVSDGTGATPNVTLNWGGGGPSGTGWDWEYHTAGTFEHIEALHAGGTWDAAAPPTTTAVAQLQDYRNNGAVELQFSVNPGVRLTLNSFDIGNATDQVASDGTYGFHIELVKDSDSSVVWSHNTPLWGVGGSGREQSVAVGYTGAPGASYTLSFARIDGGDPGNLEIYRSGLDNLSFSESTDIAPLKLVVSTTTGTVELKNQSGQSYAIDSYEITSASGSLDPAGWVSLQDSDYEGNGAPGTGNGWEEAPNGIHAGQLIEDYFLSGSTIANGASISLGQAFDFDKLGVQQDLQFGYHIAGESDALNVGVVEYISPVVDADFDNDGDIDGRDFLIWQRGFGTTGAAATNAKGNADGDSDVDSMDLAVWKAKYGTSSLLAANMAVPEPATGCLLLLTGLGCLAGTGRARRRVRCAVSLPENSVWKSGVMGAICVALLVQSALAAKTNDRRYEFGDGGTSNLQDSQFVNASQDKQDLAVGSGSPTFANVSSTGLNRPGAVTGDKGAQFDGVDDVLSGIALNRPDETAGPDIIGWGPLIFPYPFNYNKISARGMQMWVYPDATALGTGRQDIVFDTRVAGGPSISADGKWMQSFATVQTDGQIGATVPVVGNQWVHVMQHIYYATQPGFPVPDSAPRAYTGVVYVNGVAVSASNATISTCQLVGSCTTQTYIGQLVVGAAEVANDGFSALYDNHFKGVVDDLQMYVYGDNSSDPSSPPGQNYGTFSLFSDNAWIASQIAAIPGGVLQTGDVNRDGSVNQSDVTAFVSGWKQEKVLQGAFNQISVGDWETWGWGDLNLDGIVNLKDAILLDGSLISAGFTAGLDFELLTAATVPEPSAFVCGLLGMLTVGARCGPRRSGFRLS
jgi:hypothetical protein